MTMRTVNEPRDSECARSVRLGGMRGRQPRAAAARSTMFFTAAGPWKRPFSMKMRLVSAPATTPPAR